MNNGGAINPNSLASAFTNAVLTGCTGNYTGSITTDANGNGNFPVNGRGWSV